MNREQLEASRALIESLGSFREEKGYKMFKRNAFFKIKSCIDDERKAIISLTGPRKVGKTVLLKQLKDEYGDRATLYDLSIAKGEEEIEDIFLEVSESIQNNDGRIFLLDEITHVKEFDRWLRVIANNTCETVDLSDSNTKVVITGSQMHAIEKAVESAYCTQAITVRVSWLSFYEYLRFINKIDDCAVIELNNENISNLGKLVTEDDYLSYCYSSYSFNNQIVDFEGYLNSCLGETIISNGNAVLSISQQDISSVTLDKIYTFLIRILLNLKEDCSWDNLSNDTGVKKIRAFYNNENIKNKVKYSSFADAVDKINWISNETISIDKVQLRNVIRFLYSINLITVTTFDNGTDTDYDYLLKYLNEKTVLDRTDILDNAALFNRYAFTISNPMFLFCIIGQLETYLGKDLFSRAILGETFECSIKATIGNLTGNAIIRELRDDITKAEVDIYLPYKKQAIELSVADKPKGKLWFDAFPRCKDKLKVLTTRTRTDSQDGIFRVPYYLYEAIIGSEII